MSEQDNNIIDNNEVVDETHKLNHLLKPKNQ